MTILSSHAAGNLPPQRVDQLIHLVDEVLHLTLVVAAVGSDAQCADTFAVVARLGQGIRDRVVEIVYRRPLLDVSFVRGEAAAPSLSLPKVVENEDLLPPGRGCSCGDKWLGRG